jgi:hypothetical protein
MRLKKTACQLPLFFGTWTENIWSESRIYCTRITSASAPFPSSARRPAQVGQIGGSRLEFSSLSDPHTWTPSNQRIEGACAHFFSAPLIPNGVLAAGTLRPASGATSLARERVWGRFFCARGGAEQDASSAQAATPRREVAEAPYLSVGNAQPLCGLACLLPLRSAHLLTPHPFTPQRTSIHDPTSHNRPCPVLYSSPSGRLLSKTVRS